VARTSNTVYISRLQGLPVLDATGDSVGVVRDVVVQTPNLGSPPAVKGLVIDAFGRKRIFHPMDRVHAIDPSQVSIRGVIDTRAFTRRPSEALVIGDLFDLILSVADDVSEVVFDVAMTQNTARIWRLSEFALQQHTAGFLGFRSKRQVRTLPWSKVAPQLVDAEQGTAVTVAELADMRPADVARELHDMNPERRIEVASALDDEQLADAVQELPEDEQVDLIGALEPERAADVLETMDPDDAADLISDLPESLAEDLLTRMEPEEAADVRTLLSYGELTAGGMMTPEPVIIGPDGTVAEALALLRQEEVTPALASMVFICRPPLDTPSGRYIGAAHIQRLLREPPSQMAATLTDDDLHPLSSDADVHTVSRYFATYNLVVAPVVNDAGQLIGAVTVDDVMDHILPDDWRGRQLDGETPALSKPEGQQL
jgi:CBS domain-containing protein/sporulation protein YlmC with PRC-barrel domain